MVNKEKKVDKSMRENPPIFRNVAIFFLEIPQNMTISCG